MGSDLRDAKVVEENFKRLLINVVATQFPAEHRDQDLIVKAAGIMKIDNAQLPGHCRRLR
jgi:hypothetical protein